MKFHVPVVVRIGVKYARPKILNRASLELLLKDPKLNGPSLVIECSGKTIRLDIRSIFGHSEPLDLAVHGGLRYRFSLHDLYNSPENRFMLVRLLETAKLINKGKEFTPEQLLCCTRAGPIIQTFRRTWLEIAKELGIPRRETYVTRLNLTGQNLKTLPKSLGNIHLRSIILDDNLLGETIHFWNWLKGPVRNSIRFLSVKNNQLKVIPSHIVNCTQLTRINLANNDLKMLPHRLFLPPFENGYIDVSNNPSLFYWPHPTTRLQEVNIDGCLLILEEPPMRVKTATPSGPLSLLDSTASLILNSTRFRFNIGSLPHTLLDKLNWASLCHRCNKLHTQDMGETRFGEEIKANVVHGLARPVPVVTLKFECGCHQN